MLVDEHAQEKGVYHSGGITWPTRMLKVIFGRKKLTCDTCVIDFD